MKKVYKAVGTTDSWLQNKRSSEHTIFRSRGLSTELAEMCSNRDKKSSPFHRNLSPKEAAEEDNIMKIKNNLYKLSGQLVYVQIVK